jgi:ribosomal protein S27E
MMHTISVVDIYYIDDHPNDMYDNVICGDCFDLAVIFYFSEFLLKYCALCALVPIGKILFTFDRHYLPYIA